MGNLFSLALALALGFLIALGPGHGFAATGTKDPAATEAEKPQGLEEVGKQLNNPVSSIWNITTQSNMYFEKGNLSSAYRGQFVFNFQPVLPIPLTSDWNLIPRPVIPFLSNPYIRGVDTATGSLDWSRTAGMGDMAFVTFLSPNLPQWILGLGPTFIFPRPAPIIWGRASSRWGRRRWRASSPRSGWA